MKKYFSLTSNLTLAITQSEACISGIYILTSNLTLASFCSVLRVFDHKLNRPLPQVSSDARVLHRENRRSSPAKRSQSMSMSSCVSNMHVRTRCM